MSEFLYRAFDLRQKKHCRCLSSNNIKNEGSSRKTDDFEYCAGIAFDIDVHKEGVDTEKLISDTLERIMELINIGTIPRATITLHSGRGFWLHYRFNNNYPASEYD